MEDWLLRTVRPDGYEDTNIYGQLIHLLIVGGLFGKLLTIALCSRIGTITLDSQMAVV
jgi:hypothetical protein